MTPTDKLLSEATYASAFQAETQVVRSEVARKILEDAIATSGGMLLAELATLKRYDARKHSTNAGRHFTVNIPADLMRRIDEFVALVPAAPSGRGLRELALAYGEAMSVLGASDPLNNAAHVKAAKTAWRQLDTALASTAPAGQQDLREALLHLDDIEAVMGGASGPSIQLRAFLQGLSGSPAAEPLAATGSFMTREQAIEFCRKRRPSIEPTEPHIAATIDAYSALFGDMVPAALPPKEQA